MDDKVIFFILLIIGAIGAFFGISILFPSTGSASGFFGGSSLTANVLSVTGGIPSGQEGSGIFYMSYDSLQNIHPVHLPDAAGARILNVRAMDNFQTLFAGTTKGLFVSRNGGLNWDSVRIAGPKASLRQPDELSTSTIVLDIMQIRAGEYFISVLNANRGVLYHTADEFKTIEQITDFKQEVAYVLYRFGDGLYLGMSNGQLLRYSLGGKSFETLNTFPQPMTELFLASDDFYYAVLKNGSVYRAASPYSKFTKLRLPGGGLFTSASALQFAYDERGAIYIRTSDGVFRSTNAGNTFVQYRNIPLLENKIDTFGVMQGTLCILSGGRLYTSSYAGDEWKVHEVPYPQPIWNSYFIGGGKVILTQ